jgi:Disulphide bond corrector protein DsbC
MRSSGLPGKHLFILQRKIRVMKILLKYLLVSVALLIVVATVNAQNPVHWAYSSKKISENTYEIHLTATLDKGWHAYSQTQPKTAVAQPTEIKFTANPVIKIVGKPKEIGTIQHWSDPASGIAANQYAGSVDFVQTVTLKVTANTSVAGTITFQTCTDEMCLPPKTVNFNLPLP